MIQRVACTMRLRKSRGWSDKSSRYRWFGPGKHRKMAG
jgi:hypothetical protein